MCGSLSETACLCTIHALIGLLSVSSGGGGQQETLIGTSLPHHPHPPAVFQLSQTTTVAHHSLSFLCISTRFHISSSLKSELGCRIRAVWRGDTNTPVPPPYAALDPGPTTRSYQTSPSTLHIFTLNFAGSLHCWPWCQEWCQPQTHPA